METLSQKIVKYQGCFYRVRADRGKGDARWVNLGSIFGTKIYHKMVPVGEVRLAEDEWYDRWRQSESYQCM